MAREARKRSNTGIYHIMLRGIDKRVEDFISQMNAKNNDDTLKTILHEKYTIKNLTKLPMKERNKIIGDD